ncbi:sulfatase-like hydrolase/transferase [bacterium]|nr:sulfatase-like hydrolase/transferase [bacterium]RQV92034.1 MAG: arylsulfatase [bacterium]
MDKTNNSRRDFLKTVSGGILSSLFITWRCTSGRKQKPNIVLIMADDLGFECIGANGGNSYSTPVLDRLAAEGTRFEHCYAQPLCTPSRVQLMTGIYNVRNYTDFGVLDTSQVTFANLLKQVGYATCVVGKWQLGGGLEAPHHFGFDEYCLWQLTRRRMDDENRDTRYPNPKLEINHEEVNYTNGEYGPDVVSDYACDFMQHNQNRPFLLYYPMILTHCPFDPTPDSSDWNPKSSGSLNYKGDIKYFGNMVSYMDKMVGKIVNKLEELSLRENTLVLFTGDNGTDEPVVSYLDHKEISGGKGLTTDAGTHVPLIVNWPGVTPEGHICRDMVDFSDIFPTICDCTELTTHRDLKIDGRSFLPQLKGEKGNPREWIYCWFSRNGNVEEARVFARNHRYKLYQTGEFYDIQNDILEKVPLHTEDLGEPELSIRKMLENALEQYKNIR